MKRLLATLAATGVLLAGGVAVAVPAATAAPVNTVSITTSGPIAKPIHYKATRLAGDFIHTMGISKKALIDVLRYEGYTKRVSRIAAIRVAGPRPAKFWKKQARRSAQEPRYWGPRQQRRWANTEHNVWNMYQILRLEGFTKKQSRIGARSAGVPW